MDKELLQIISDDLKSIKVQINTMDAHVKELIVYKAEQEGIRKGKTVRVATISGGVISFIVNIIYQIIQSNTKS